MTSGYDGDMERRYNGYDEYEGIFGPIGGFNDAYSTHRGLRRQRNHRNRSKSSQIRTYKRTSTAYGQNDFAQREKYLVARQSKRRVKAFDMDPVGEEEEPQSSDIGPSLRVSATNQSAVGALQKQKQQLSQDHQLWLPTRDFSFRQRAGKLDTRAIARLDLERIVATTDIDTIQRHLENLAFADITLDDVQQYSDAYFLKLFQIAQLTLEYLMNVQDSLVDHSNSLETQCEQLLIECQQLETENNTHEAEITNLKKEIRQKQRTLATFEVMLLNASMATNNRSLAQRDGSQTVDKENAGDTANALMVELLSRKKDGDHEEGSIGKLATCVICGKKFVSAEYLLRHQQKRHQQDTQEQKVKKKKQKQKPVSCSTSSSSSEVESDQRKKSKSKKQNAANAVSPLSREVIQAAEEKTALAKQLLVLQEQLRLEKDARHEEAKRFEDQQSQLTTQLTEYMGKLQYTLLEIERKQEDTKREIMTTTQQTIERLKHEAANAEVLKRQQISSRAGKLENDEDDRKVETIKQKAKDEEGDWTSKIEKLMDTFLRAQAQKQQEIDALAQENSELWSKHAQLVKKKKKKRLMTSDTALRNMAALEVKRFGVDRGEVMEQPIPVSNFPLAVKTAILEDKPVQTDDEKENEPRKAIAKSVCSQEIQTDILPSSDTKTKTIVETQKPVSLPAQERKSMLRQPAPSKRIPPSMKTTISLPIPVVEQVESEPKVNLPNVEAHEKKAEPTPLPPESKDSDKNKESRFQHAAHIVAKVALGYLTRKALHKPENWMLTLPIAAIESSLSEAERSGLRDEKNSELQIQVEENMTANDLRVAVATALTDRIESEDESIQIDYHRVLLHHIHTHDELSGDRLVHPFKNQIAIELIPRYAEAEEHVEQVLQLRQQISAQLQEIKRASMEFAPGSLGLLRGKTTDQDERDALRKLIRLQACVRMFLAKRKAEILKIDRLVDARVVKMRDKAGQQRKSQAQINFTSIRKMVTSEARAVQKIEKQLTEAIQTKTASSDISRLASAAYEHHLKELEQARTRLPPEVQERIRLVLERMDMIVKNEYDQLKVQQQRNVKIPNDKHAATTRKRLETLLGDKKNKREEQPHVSQLEPRGLTSTKSSLSSLSDDEINDQSLEDFDDREIEKLADAYEEGKENDEAQRKTGAQASVLTSIMSTDPEEKKEGVASNDSPPTTPRPHPTPLNTQTSTALTAQPRVSTPITKVEPKTYAPGANASEDELGRSPRPKQTSLISPFSQTPLISRRTGSFARRGSGYDNAR